MWRLGIYPVIAGPPEAACFVGILHSPFFPEEPAALGELWDVCAMLDKASALQRGAKQPKVTLDV